MTSEEQAAARKAARQKALNDIAKPLVGDFPNPNDYWKYRWPAPQEKTK